MKGCRPFLSTWLSGFLHRKKRFSYCAGQWLLLIALLSLPAVSGARDTAIYWEANCNTDCTGAHPMVAWTGEGCVGSMAEALDRITKANNQCSESSGAFGDCVYSIKYNGNTRVAPNIENIPARIDTLPIGLIQPPIFINNDNVLTESYSVYVEYDIHASGSCEHFNTINPWSIVGGAIWRKTKRVRPEKSYRVTLSNPTKPAQDKLAELEPTDNLSQASGKNSTYLLAQVHDEKGLLVPVTEIQLRVSVLADSGGHRHDVGKDRNTKQMGYLASLQGNTAQNGKVLTGNTGAYGLAFTFTAPAPAGDHVITAGCVQLACEQQGPRAIWVGVKDLVPLGQTDDWVLIGDTAIHPDNHYLSQKAVVVLTELAQDYRSKFPQNPVLHLNDASLERGGVFDLGWVNLQAGSNNPQWWLSPHKEHRRGVVIDIRANNAPGAVPVNNRRKFERSIAQMNIKYVHEATGTDNEHYHVRLVGLSL